MNDAVALIPDPPIHVAQFDEAGLTPQKVAVQIKMMEAGHLGFEMEPYSPDSTKIQVKNGSRRLLLEALKIGAYLWRAKVNMDIDEGRGAFWRWFGEQDFGFGRRWAEKVMNLAQWAISNPEIYRTTKQITGSIRKFEHVVRRLSTPEGASEWEERGTVLGIPGEKIDQTSLQKLEEAAAAAGELKRATRRLKRELEEKEKALAERGRELARTQKRLLEITNPDLNQEEIRKKFLGDLVETRRVIWDLASKLRPSLNKSLDALGPREIAQLLATLIFFEKVLNLTTSEVEAKWGKDHKSFLYLHQDFSHPATLRELKVYELETWQALIATQGALVDGRDFVIARDHHGKEPEVIWPAPELEEEVD